LLTPSDTPEFHGNLVLLICNPLYISKGKFIAIASKIIGHELRLAFDGGPLGIHILQRLIEEAPRFLKAGGVLAFEIGMGQGRGIRKRLEQSNNYTNIFEAEDLNGQTRALTAFFSPAPR